MVLGVRGPKAIFCSYLAKALSDYFVVDRKSIEANLFKDTKIVLHNVQLQQQSEELLRDACGRTLVLTVSGVVEEIAFTWTWSAAASTKKHTFQVIDEGTSGEGWVRNASLTMKGLKIKAEMTYAADNSDGKNTTSSNQEQIEEDSATTTGKMYAYIQKQVDFLIDSLTLNVSDMEFSLVMPRTDESDETTPCFAIVVGGKSIQLLSFGREKTEKNSEMESSLEAYENVNDTSDTSTILEQRLTVGAFYANVISISTAGGDKTTDPLIDPFSYSATVTRHAGIRFSSGIDYGLEIVGRPIATAVEAKANALDNGIVFYAGNAQVTALTQLGRLLSDSSASEASESAEASRIKESGAPDSLTSATVSDPESSLSGTSSTEPKPGPEAAAHKDGSETPGQDTTETENEKSVEDKDSPSGGGLVHAPAPKVDSFSPANESSIFKLPMSSVSVILADGTTITMKQFSMTYRVDGSFCTMKVKSFVVADASSTDGLAVSISGIRANLLPTFEMELDVVETVRIPGVFLLVNHLHDSTVKFVRDTLDITVTSVEAMLLDKNQVVSSSEQEADNENNPVSCSGKQEVSSSEKQLSENKYADGSEDASVKKKEEEKIEMTASDREKTITESPPAVGQENMPLLASPEPGDTQSQKKADDVSGVNVSMSGAVTFETAQLPDDAASQVKPVLVADDVGASGGNTLDNPSGSQAQQGEKDQETGSSSTSPVPFPVRISYEKLVLGKAKAGSRPTRLSDFVVDIFPDSGGTFVAFSAEEFKNDLLQLKNMACSAIVDFNNFELVRNFMFAAEAVVVTAGYSSTDWSKEFDVDAMHLDIQEKDEPVEKPKPKSKGKSESEPAVVMLPEAQVAAMKFRITVKGKVLASKDTVLNIKPFIGDANTTAKDVVNFYARGIIKRVPHFITNAEVLGLNVFEQAAVTYGTWYASNTLLGPAGGLAGVAAVDAIKGTIVVGKKKRNAAADDQWKFGDFFRGLLYSCEAITKSGAKTRGKGDEETRGIADFVVGLTTGTGQYVGHNKARISAAGAGGVGMIVGYLLAGPLGGIAGGVLVTVMADKTIEGVGKYLTEDSEGENESS